VYEVRIIITITILINLYMNDIPEDYITKRNPKLFFGISLLASIGGAALAQNKISVGVESTFSIPTGNFRAFAGSCITPDFQFNVGLLENLILAAKPGYTDWSEKVAPPSVRLVL